MMGHMHTGMPLLKKISGSVNKSVATFLNTYLPLRTETEELYQLHLGNVISKCKPAPGTYYFGLLLGEKSVLATFKSSPHMLVTPQGK
jgi:hypothetical protein